MRLDYCTHLTTPGPDGKPLVIEPDIDCAVEAEIEWLGTPQGLKISAVYLPVERSEGHRLIQAGEVDALESDDPLVLLKGQRIALAAAQDDDLLQEALDQEGHRYVGRGGNDPDAYWIRGAA